MTVLMDGHMLYIWEIILYQEYFSGVKFFEHIRLNSDVL